MTTNEQQNSQPLFVGFSPATEADWEQKARKDLRDTPLENLTWHTYEGIDVKPYYAKEDIAGLPLTNQKPGNFPFMRGSKAGGNGWQNVQQIQAAQDGRQAIAKAANALQRGADGVHLLISHPEEFDVAALLEAVDLSKNSVSYTLPANPKAFLKRLYRQLEQKNSSHRNLKGFVCYDPATSKGKLSEAEKDEMAAILDLTKDSPAFYGVTVCGTNFSGLGASATQEIAYTLSAAVAYLDRLTTAGEPLESVMRNMQFYVAAGTNYFFEIAKLRALRLLWAVVVETYQASPSLASRLRIHSVTSSWYQTTLDPYVNMLRATTEAMATVIAGCDSLTVQPFDSTFKESDEFSERIARNVSTILKEEAYLDKAIDPAAGSYYLESLTDGLAQKAWALFNEVETQGGFEQAYESGFILGSITEVSRQKFRNIATGRDVLVGTNKYPNPKEKLPFNPEELIQSSDFDTTRAAYPTEVMRMATELHQRKRNRRPKTVIAVIGNADQRHVDATFAHEFFSCAGFETEQLQFASVEEASDKLNTSTAEVVVVASSEKAYMQEFGPRLRNHHAKPTLILAADPQHMKEEMLANGYEDFIFDGCDMKTLLEAVQRRLAHDDNEA